MVPSDDRGLAYGDGVFETILVRDGHPSLWGWHCTRLARGCRRLGFMPPAPAVLNAQCANLPTEGLYILKLIVTRGSGGRGYCPPDVAAPRLIRRLLPFSAQSVHWRSGVAVRLCHLTMASQPLLAGIKHLNRLENVLARQEWQEASIAEGLMCNARGEVVEATAMNVVWCEGGRWFTPTTSECGVAGTLVEALTDAGRLDTATLAFNALTKIKGLAVLNSVQGLWPVHSLLDKEGQPMVSFDIDIPEMRALQQQAHALLGYPAR